MNKWIVILGLILIIVGILPIILEMTGFASYAALFYLGIYELPLGTIVLSELMLILIILGVILLIIGALR